MKAEGRSLLLNICRFAIEKVWIKKIGYGRWEIKKLAIGYRLWAMGEKTNKE
jgi:hypothetical protein